MTTTPVKSAKGWVRHHDKKASLKYASRTIAAQAPIKKAGQR